MFSVTFMSNPLTTPTNAFYNNTQSHQTRLIYWSDRYAMSGFQGDSAMTSQTTEMTALDYTHAAHQQLAAGNERKAAGLLWKAAEATFIDLARKRGIECDGDDSLIDLAKALEADGSVRKGYYSLRLGAMSTLRVHAEQDVLERWDLMALYEDSLDFIIEANNGKR